MTAVQEEEAKLARLRVLVDKTAHRMLHCCRSEAEAAEAIRQTREAVLALFPGKARLYDLIYPARFRRLYREWGHGREESPSSL